MKKRISLTILIMVFILISGCGSQKFSEKIVGTWLSISMVDDNYILNDIDEMQLIISETGDVDILISSSSEKENKNPTNVEVLDHIFLDKPLMKIDYGTTEEFGKIKGTYLIFNNATFKLDLVNDNLILKQNVRSGFEIIFKKRI